MKRLLLLTAADAGLLAAFGMPCTAAKVSQGTYVSACPAHLLPAARLPFLCRYNIKAQSSLFGTHQARNRNTHLWLNMRHLWGLALVVWCLVGQLLLRVLFLGLPGRHACLHNRMHSSPRASCVLGEQSAKAGAQLDYAEAYLGPAIGAVVPQGAAALGGVPGWAVRRPRAHLWRRAHLRRWRSVLLGAT